MTFEERIDRLTERHEALTQFVEKPCQHKPTPPPFDAKLTYGAPIYCIRCGVEIQWANGQWEAVK